MSLNQGREEVFLQKRQRLLVVLFQKFLVLSLFMFLIERCCDLAEDRGEVVGVDRLQKVFDGVEMNSLLGIFKFIKTRKDNDTDIGIEGAQLPGQLETIHVGHLDVGHDNVGLYFFGKLQRLDAIGRFTGLFQSQRCPVNFSADDGENIVFIVCEQYFVCHGLRYLPACFR